jgi:hypothetical protein
MRVRFRNPSRESCPTHEARYVVPTQIFLTANEEYEVHAISVYDGVVFVLIADDDGTPSFEARFLFDVVDTSIPADWICNIFPTDPVQLVMGPPFLAKDRASYSGMIDFDPVQIDAFRHRIDAQKAAEAQHCPVCGLDQGLPPYGDHGDDPTFYTCDCCGVEYNIEPMTPERARDLRQCWLDSGAKWLRPEMMPEKWDKAAQLREVPRQFQ